MAWWFARDPAPGGRRGAAKLILAGGAGGLVLQFKTLYVLIPLGLWIAALVLAMTSPALGQDVEPVPAGGYEPGTGFVVARGEEGMLAVSLWTYLRSGLG